MDNYQTYLVDWTGLPSILETQIFETSSAFDALNRVTKITLPENVNNERKEITPTYNRAGALEKVSYDNTEYVENIAYNAKGQRLLIAFGNDIMTRYVYDNRTFRLLRQRSEKFAKTLEGNKIIYTPQSGTNKQDDGFNFDLIGNILKILNRVNDCGISGSALGSDALDRNFEYDPLYRVISGDGRESNTQNQNDYLYSDAPAPGSPNANNVRAYTRKYTFDKLGNIQQLKQLGTNGFTRNFTYNAGYNTLQKIETAAPSLLEDFTYDPCGNQLTAGTTGNYVWNSGNQLITYYNQVGSADPTIFAQYDYSGMNRVSKLVKTGTSASPIYERTIYIDGIFEYHILENGTTYEKNYVHIMDDQSRIAMVRIGTPFPDDIADAVVYNLEDQIGSSTIRLNNNGGIIDKEEYYPFGDSSFRTFTKKRYRYVGKEKDLESGLYYYGARYYAAWTCRFISVDPLASDYVHLTPYNNAGNKPINSIDIDGLQGANEARSGVDENTGNAKSFQQEVKDNPVEITAKRIPTDQVSEKAKSSGWTRFWGGVQAVVGIVLSAAASVAIGSGLGAVVGVPLLAYSADLAAAGINQAATGEQTNTFFFEGTKKTAKGFGASEETANNIAIGTDIVVGAALTGGSSNTKYIGTIPKVVAGGGVVAKTESLVKIGIVEGDVMMFSSKIGTETIEGITNFAVKDGKLYLNQLHLQGSSAGNVGRESLWNMAKDLGRQYNVKEVIIQGGKRTTGKYKGQVPSPITIKVD